MTDRPLPAADSGPERLTSPGPAARALAPIMALVCLVELAARVSGLTALEAASWLLMGSVVVLAFPRLGLRETYLLVLSACLAGLIVAVRPDPLEVLRAALDQASFLMVFLLLIGLLHAAAATSPSVAACGEYTTRQPPGRRYYALSTGTAILAVLFNLGVVSFLVPLIQKGIALATPGDALNPVRERRQVSALLRGFAWSVVWSPTALAPLALAALIPGTNRPLWMLYGVVIQVILTVIGALEDRLTFRRYRPSGPRPVTRFPVGAALRFLAAAAWLFVLAGVAVWLSGDSAIFGLLMACPVVVVGWLAVQAGAPRPGWVGPTATRLAEICAGLPLSAPVAITLACSGFIGRAAGAMVPAEALAEWLRLDAMPDCVLMAAIPVAMSILSLLALSPIMMAVFFGSIFAALPVLPADPTLIALSISCGWGLSMTFSPFATVVLVIDRVAGIPARRVTWGWNFRFTLLAAVTLLVVFFVLTGGT